MYGYINIIDHYSHCEFFFGHCHSLAPRVLPVVDPLAPHPRPPPPLTMSAHTPTSFFPPFMYAPLPLNVHAYTFT